MSDYRQISLTLNLRRSSLPEMQGWETTKATSEELKQIGHCSTRAILLDIPQGRAGLTSSLPSNVGEPASRCESLYLPADRHVLCGSRSYTAQSKLRS